MKESKISDPKLEKRLSVEETIRARAYELYLSRGLADGHSEEDWLQAEQEFQNSASRQFKNKLAA